jgi:hypothetical protein
MVDGAAAGVAEFQMQQRSRPQPREDRKRIEDAISALAKVRRSLNGLGPEGKGTLVHYEYSLSGLVSAAWLHQRFSGDPLAPIIAGLAADFEHPPLDQRQRRLFIQNRPALVINAICEELDQVLHETLLLLKLHRTAKGGRKRETARYLMIQSIVRAWTIIGRKLSTDPKSEFMEFVEAIIVSIGWSATGLPTAVAKAVKDWRNLPRKKAR